MLLGPTIPQAQSASGRTRAAPSISLERLSGLQPRRTYAVVLNGSQHIGVVVVTRVDPRELRARIDVKVPPVGGFQGELTLRLLDQHGRLRLQLHGRQANGQPERSDETVSADPFLLQNGVLTFRWRGGTRFFQLTRGKDGVTKVTTDWGTAGLVPEKRR